jgi:hypothetical protein
MVWEAFNGPIPAGQQINHTNGNKTDNRLANLEVCTPSENMVHSFRVLKRPPANNPNPGTANGASKLTEADIPVIRALYEEGTRQADIGQRFGVSQALVSRIIRGVNWRHV